MVGSIPVHFQNHLGDVTPDLGKVAGVTKSCHEFSSLFNYPEIKVQNATLMLQKTG